MTFGDGFRHFVHGRGDDQSVDLCPSKQARRKNVKTGFVVFFFPD